MEVTETALTPVLVLSAALLASWSLWVVVLYPLVPDTSPGRHVVTSVAARLVFWLVPSGIYLFRYWGRRWRQPLGVDFPLGRAQLLRTVAITLVVTLLLFWGTAVQKGIAPGALARSFLNRAQIDLTAPLFEELVFRGLVLGELINWVRDSSTGVRELRAKFWGVLLLSALVFLLVHWPWWLTRLGWGPTLDRSLPVLVTGVILGFVFAQTRSVWACVLLHWVNNQLSGVS
jgi:hypothetical protein